MLNRILLEKIKQYVPVSDILKQVIGAEVLDGDVDQVTAAPINGVVAHVLQLLHLVVKTVISHIDFAPHERVLADPAPFRAHLLSALQHPDRTDTCQYRRREDVREFQPVSPFDYPYGFGCEYRWTDGQLVLFLAAHLFTFGGNGVTFRVYTYSFPRTPFVECDQTISAVNQRRRVVFWAG